MGQISRSRLSQILNVLNLSPAIQETLLYLPKIVTGPDRITEKALGTVHFGIEAKEASSRVFRRSLFVVQDVKRGETFSAANVRSIRPGYGLHTRHLPEVVGRHATCDIERGTPLRWDLVQRT